MRVPTKLQPDKPVTYLWERHKEIARRVLCGQKPIEICRELGYTPAWMSCVMNSPVFKTYLASLRERTEESVCDVRQRIKEGSEIAVDYLLDTLKNRGADQVQASLKVKIAQDFLDRAGHSKTIKVEEERTIRVLDEAKIQALKDRRSSMLANLRIDDAVLAEPQRSGVTL